MGTKKSEVEATKTSFSLIRELKQERRASLTEIAMALDLPKSTVFYHLNTLQELGYVVKKEEKYQLSLRFLELGELARSQLPVYEAGKDQVEELAKETNANGYLTVEQNDFGVIIHLRKENEINLGDYIGQTVYLTSTAMGKAILAYLPVERVDEVIDHHGMPKMTSSTVTDREALEAELEKVRERGYAVSRGEQVKGLRAVAAPITSSDDIVYGTLSIAGPEQLMSDDRLQNELPEKVLSAANVVELKLFQQASN
jgi:DNA-binding IclR family transcriptional regulator